MTINCSDLNSGTARSVLVTGASTGIGRLTVERLAAQGHRVYAGVRKPSDFVALSAIENVQPLRLDVTVSGDIAAARDAISAHGTGLYGLVNNAGVATLGSVLDTTEAELDLVMSVNMRAVYRITQAFVPLITASKGRIVMIGSVSGILAEGRASIYSMSKHAIEAFTDSLAQELQPDGVKVSVVEPGVFRTKLVENAIQRVGDPSEFPPLLGEEPHEVASAVLHALFSANARTRYLVVPNRADALRVIKQQIARLVQLNGDQRHGCDREELISILDEALSRYPDLGATGATFQRELTL